MSRKSTLDALFAVKPRTAELAPESKSADALPSPSVTTANPASESRIRSGAIGAMGASLQQLQDSAREADALRQSLVGAESIVLLDATLIDAAPVSDRFRRSVGVYIKPFQTIDLMRINVNRYQPAAK